VSFLLPANSCFAEGCIPSLTSGTTMIPTKYAHEENASALCSSRSKLQSHIAEGEASGCSRADSRRTPLYASYVCKLRGLLQLQLPAPRGALLRKASRQRALTRTMLRAAVEQPSGIQEAKISPAREERLPLERLREDHSNSKEMDGLS